jgi:hypothetical protein
MLDQTPQERLEDHSRRLLDLVQQADLETLAAALHPALEERDRLMEALSDALATGWTVAPAARAHLEGMDRQIAEALARRREEARLALITLPGRSAPLRPKSLPPPRFLDQKG